MKANNSQKDSRKGALEDYVTIAIAEDIDLANEYRDILARHEIPAVTATQKSYSSDILGTAVMVPEHLLEQAQEIIESQQDFDHFLDDAFNDPDNWNDEPNPDEYEERENFYDDENI